MLKTLDKYKPPSEFQEVEEEPILKEALSDSTELWLIQMPLTQFEPADFAGKQLSLKLTKEDGWTGCLENSHVRKIARHICLLKSTNENGDAFRAANSSVSFSASQIQDSQREGISHNQGTSSRSTGYRSSHVASGISFEGEEPLTKGQKMSLKERKLDGTPTASYSKSLEESGAYDSSDPECHSPRASEYTEDTCIGGKKKKLKSESPKK